MRSLPPLPASIRRGAPASIVALALLAALCVTPRVAADDAAAPVPVAPAPPLPAAPPPTADDAVPAASRPFVGRGFDTPEAVAKALFDAFEQNDDAALRGLFGPGNDDLVRDGDDPSVRTERAELAAAAKQKLSFDRQPDGRVLLLVGRMDYPLAIPLVATDGAWRADATAGRREVLARRIGANELEAVGICLAYADAQVAYASKDRNDDGVKEYAQRLVSTPGTKDGLSWDASDDDDRSPAGPGLLPLRDALRPDATPLASFNGYYWRILSAQGPSAPGGAYSYVLNGRMIAGFALLAVPAVHRNTGVMSFVVSNQGKIYEKDLGAETLTAAVGIVAFDPDPSWREVDETTLRAAATTSPDDAPFVEQGAEVSADAGASPGPLGPQPSAAAAPPAPAQAPTPPAPAPAPCPQRP